MTYAYIWGYRINLFKQKTYKFSYVYIYTIIQTMYNLNLVIGTHRIFALYIQTNSGIWINFSDQLQNMTLRPARMLGIPLVAGHLWKQNLPKGKTPISVAKAHLNRTQIIQC